VLRLPRIHQQHLEALTGQQIVQGIQYTPVDSIATVVTPQSFSHAAIASRSPVFVPNLRTPAGSLSSALMKPAGTSSAATATKCSRLCTSIPAACRCRIARSSACADLRNSLPARGVITSPPFLG
jgi:hypothetical protein